MMHYGPIELHTKILWVCLHIRWFKEKHVIYLLNLKIKHIGLLKSSIMTSNLPVRRGCLILAHLMNGEPKHMRMPSFSKKKSNAGMIKRIQKREFNVGDYVLLFNSRLRFFVGKLLSKQEGPYIIEEVYHSGAIKINNFEGTNPRVVSGQRIKHYISGNPINVETNIIETVTPEEYIRDTFQNVSDSNKE